jgi:hypothetical protein
LNLLCASVVATPLFLAASRNRNIASDGTAGADHVVSDAGLDSSALRHMYGI